MALQEAEAKLAELNEKIEKLLKEREDVLKEWETAFHTENPENIMCIDENVSSFHELYLVNGDSKLPVCHFTDRDMKGGLDEFYKVVDNSMRIFHIAHDREREISECEKNLVFQKAAEIRNAFVSEDV